LADRKRTTRKSVTRTPLRQAAPGASTPASPPEPAPNGFPVVGIGASAGGLEAIEELFRHMPADTGMAFVLVQHLDPNHKSILTELIARFTPMPVHEAVQGLPVEPNHIYVIPPRHDLAILNGVLQLMDPTGPRHLRLSIDYFFRSLARDQGANAFCIVLSGAGSDGTLGLRAVKGEDGVALVQNPETAAYDSMPRSADATGLADAVLTPREMGPWLQAYNRHSRLPGTAGQIRHAIESSGEADKLFVLVRNRAGYDFSQYKEGTVGRRIERRMAVNHIDTLENYIRLLQQNPAELDRLWKEFLIRVTQFFRNPKVMTTLAEKAIASLLEDRPAHEPIRVWVPGCSTGEEAYTIALLLQERLDRLGRTHSVQIFATDIDEEALQIARQGCYPASIAADVPVKYLRRYFLKHEQGFQIGKALRGMLVFARHDITRDPPFSQMDLVSCRNLLIYMRPQLQARVLDSLTYALRPGGVLFLGHSESLGKFADFFETIDSRSKIYRRSGRAITGLNPQPRVRRRTSLNAAESLQAGEPQGEDLQRSTEAALLTDHTPACVVVDNKHQVLYIHGHTGLFLEPAMGRASMNLLKMAREGLRSELSSALREAGTTQQPSRFERLRVKTRDGERLVDLTVRPLPAASAPAGTLMVLFEDGGPVRRLDEVPAGSSGDSGAFAARSAWLEQELSDARETLQNANEELETSNEELQSTVEELQSSNEELMTSQEELSSINEELHTVNVELEEKVQLLELTTNDLENLLVSTEIGTVFLDLDLRVRRFTPSATKVINLIASDIGRPLNHIAHKLDYDHLIADAEAVLDSLQPKTVEVRSTDGVLYSLRITLYRAGNNAIDGVVLTFVDLSERMLAERRFHDLLELTPDAMVISSPRGEIAQVNRQAERLFGYSQDELLGKSVEALIPARLRDRHAVDRQGYQRYPRARPMGQGDLKLIALRKDGSEFPVDIAIGPIQTDEGPLFAASVRDVSESRRTQVALQRTNNMFHCFCEWNQSRFLSGEKIGASLYSLCRRLVEQVGYRQCWIGLGGGNDADVLTLLAHAGFSGADAEALDASLIDPGCGPDPRVMRDFSSDAASSPLQKLAMVWGCHAILAAPMMAGEHRVGIFVITAAESDAFPREEIALWKNLSTTLGVMLSQAQITGSQPAKKP
jgi:two-component system CheB/CheR fusion protein